MGKNKNIAIIGASYLQLPLILKAKELGYITHVFAWKANDVGENEADFFYPISIIEKDKILDECKKIGICGICSIGSDVAVLTVNYIAEKLSLIGNSIKSGDISTNKYLMRCAFKENNDPIPKFKIIKNTNELNNIELEYPVIVKPIDRSGSRGVYKLYNKEKIEESVSSAIELSYSKTAIIEEFVEGDEYSVEYISYNSKHMFLAITKKYTTGNPHFIETAHLEPAPLDNKIVTKVKFIIEHALDTLQIKNGASHSEIKINSAGDIKIIEIGSRMGGDCIGSDLVYYSTGFDYVKMVIDVACGNSLDFSKKIEPFKVKCIYIFDNNDLIEYEKLKNEHPEQIVKLVYLNKENLGKATDSSNRAGCYIRKV